MKHLLLTVALLLVAVTASASYEGSVYVDRNGNGIRDNGEKALRGVRVSDGLNVTLTDAQGHFSLPGHARARFVFVSTPSGYKALPTFYRRIASGASYDFGLTPYSFAQGKNGRHSFVHISDTEIFNTQGNERWANDLRDYAHESRPAFIIHTGDICYDNGLRAHIKLLNTQQAGVPVYYCIGNHDLVKGDYGEQLYESLYGPVFYSFDVAGVHYVVTPMRSGDYAPSYTFDDVARWLRNDLATVKPGTPVVAFNHDLLTNGDHFVLKGKSESIDLNVYNLRAWVYGHWHNNLLRQQGDVLTVSTGPLDKGGIDHSTNIFRVVSIDRAGKVTSECRFPYLHEQAAVAAPQGTTSSRTVVVNAYNSARGASRVICSVMDGTRRIASGIKLRSATDWSWTGTLPDLRKYAGQPLKLRAEVFFGKEPVTVEQSFTYEADPKPVELTADWDNLLGNAQHVAPAHQALDSTLHLAWVSNVGANIFMTSPVVHRGRIYTATVDEDMKGKAYIYCLDGATGRLLWKYKTGSSIKNTIAVADGLVFAQDALAHVYAIDCASGQLRWEQQLPTHELPALVEGVATNGNEVFVGTGKFMEVLDTKTGRLIWRNKDWNQNQGASSTIAANQDVVVSSAQWSALYANDVNTGKMLWSRSDSGLRFRAASPALIGGLIYITSEKSFFILDAKTGRTIVRKDLPCNLETTSTPVVTDKYIIFGTADKGLMALDSQTLELKWNFQTQPSLVYTCPYTRPNAAAVETSPVVCGDTVYAACSDGTLYGVDINTGRKVWSFTSGAPMLSTVAVSGNALVASDYGGNVYLFR